MRSPKRSCVRSCGGCSFASRPHSSGAPLSRRPNAEHCSAAQPAPSRSSASTSGRFAREQVVARERRHLVGAARREHRHTDTIRLGANGQDPRGGRLDPPPDDRHPGWPAARSSSSSTAPSTCGGRRSSASCARSSRRARSRRTASRSSRRTTGSRPTPPRCRTPARSLDGARRAHRPRTGPPRRARLEPRRARAPARPPARAARVLRALPPVRQLLPPAHRRAGVALPALRAHRPLRRHAC